MPPILSHVVEHQQQAHHTPPRHIRQHTSVFGGQPSTQLGGSQHGQWLCDGQQANEHKQFKLGIVGGCMHSIFVAPADNFCGSVAQDHAKDQGILNLVRVQTVS